jgi:small subunit ribosomal protein S4
MLLQLLESRLDTVAYRMGFRRVALRIPASCPSQRRAGKRSSGEYSVVSRFVRVMSSKFAEKAKGQLRVKAALAAAESRGFPEWVSR